MAEPLRKDPEFQQQPAARQFNVHRYGNPNRGSRHWWFWILLAAVIIWFVIWGRGSKHAQPQATLPASAPPPVATPATPALDVNTLLANPQNYIGKHVHLRDVLVQSVNGTYSIFVGPSNSQQVLVLLKQGAVPKTLQGKVNPLPSGGVVTIDGTAQKPGSAGELEHSAHIARKDADQVVKQGIVIEADTAVPQTF